MRKIKLQHVTRIAMEEKQKRGKESGNKVLQFYIGYLVSPYEEGNI